MNGITSSPDNKTAVPTAISLALALLRIVIGWHFLYEGLSKLLTPNWSASSYLLGSTGPFAEMFRTLAGNPVAMPFVNQFNIWGLILIGAGLMLGLFARTAAACGMLLLSLYYVANPPFFQIPSSAQEGHYLLVNKNLVELMALGVTLVLPASQFGLDRLLARRRHQNQSVTAVDEAVGSSNAEPPDLVKDVDRRRFLAWFGLPFAGTFALAAMRRHYWRSTEERVLADAYSGATAKVSAAKRIEDLKGRLPQGQIGNLKLSRMILGGNLIGGWAHARDLLYASALVKAYNHRGKIFETLSLAEACGVNTLLTNTKLCPTIKDYWRSTGGKIQFISDCGAKNLLEGIQTSIDTGASACYIHGGIGDALVAKGDFDLIGKALDLIRRNGIPAGIGGHKLETVKGCREHGLKPDFWMKTLHPGNYWSAGDKQFQRGGYHDNFYCEQPDEVAAYMNEVHEPWIAFKILAAGAIHPKEGFRYAFEHGADFICVGMYDFQIVEDVNIALGILNENLKRQRTWYA